MPSQVAQIILEQFGGNRSMFMIGGKNICSIDEGRGALSFKHMPAKVDGKRVNYCKIVLADDDLYRVEFGYLTAKKYTAHKVRSHIFGDQLMSLFANETGLSLRI